MFRIKTCKSKIQKIIIIALIAAVAVAAMLLPMLTKTSVSYASNTGTPATFLRIRNGTISDPGSDRDFASYDFQRNEDNFNHIEAYQIADLIDSKHGVDLRTQSNAIQQTEHITKVPVLTVITHGQGSHAGAWSNAGIEDNKSGVLVYQEDSIIERLRRQSGANVYVARSHILTRENRNYRGAIFASLGPQNPSLTRPLISLFPLEGIYEDWKEPTNRLTGIRDYHRHNILVFESQDSLNYRNFVYNELNAILTMISYDYLQATGMIPLINMISHSTGGPWNMMWANNHPNNVHSMYAIAGTFKGSDMGTAIREDWLAWYTFSAPYEMVNNPSSFDNTDTLQQDSLMAGWQSAVTLNPDLKLYTLAGETCWDLLATAPEWGGRPSFIRCFLI